MFRWQQFHLVLAIYGLLASTSAFITTRALFLIPSGTQNSIFLGFSFQRLIMMGSVFLAGILLAVFAIKAYRNKPWSERIRISLFARESSAKGILWGSAIGLSLGMIVSCMPMYRFGEFQGYFIRAFPIFIWITLVSLLTFIVAWIEKHGFDWAYFLAGLRTQRIVLSIALITMTTIVLLWVFIAKTGVGLWVRDGFWYGAGVPVLAAQIVFALVIGMAVLFLEKSYGKNYLPKWLEVLVFFLFWGITAFLWAREPLRPSFFAPGPYAPNNGYYPYSDAASFDMGSQFALIGQGIYNNVFFDRVLYIAFLVFLHTLAGQDYVQIVTLQAAIYAVFPAILYLLGKSIHSRSFGAILAVLVMLRGINGIAAGSMINLANQKQLLTDFPTVIFVAWFTLMMVLWLKEPAKNYIYACWAGGVIGLAIMLRTNALFLMPFAILLAGIVYWRQKLRGALVGFLLVFTMFAGTFAWGIYNDKSVFDIYIYRILIVIEARYPQLKPVTPVPASNATALPTSDPSINVPTQLDTLSQLSTNITSDSEIKPVPVFVTIHFLHNLITSVFTLPTSIELHDLRHTLKDGAPFWESYWNGNLTFSAGFFLTLNLFLISLGVGVGWKSARLSGLAPLGVFLFYNLANAFARTSGGRYLVPTDWVVLFYFALGLFQIILWGTIWFGVKNERNTGNTSTVQDNEDGTNWTWEPLKKAPWVVLIFLVIGTSLPLSERFFPRRYPVRTQTELLTLLEQEGYLGEMGFDRPTLDSLSDQWPAFKVINGRVLYPRYFQENDGIPQNRFPYNVMGYPRIAFTMIGPNGQNYVILPQDEVPYFPNASDVIVLGCQNGEAIDALAVLVIEKQTEMYVRQPTSPLQCPLREPVCNQNHVCQ